jgi:hypothetical protein
MFFDVGPIRADITFALRPVILVACKAAELRWPTFHAVHKARFAYDLSATKSDYLKLSVSTSPDAPLLACPRRDKNRRLTHVTFSRLAACSLAI